jgi:hypothetical protein
MERIYEIPGEESRNVHVLITRKIKIDMFIASPYQALKKKKRKESQWLK